MYLCVFIFNIEKKNPKPTLADFWAGNLSTHCAILSIALFAFDSMASSCSNGKTHLQRFASSAQHKRASVCSRPQTRAAGNARFKAAGPFQSGANSERISKNSNNSHDALATGTCCFHQAEVQILVLLGMKLKDEFKVWISHLHLKVRAFRRVSNKSKATLQLGAGAAANQNYSTQQPPTAGSCRL